jgi:hypothetical protein
MYEAGGYMIKTVLIFFSVFITGIGYAGQAKVDLRDYHKVELCFENVVIDEITFKGTSEIKINFDSEDDVTVKRDANKIIITAPTEKTKIDLVLPKHRTYYYTMTESDNEAYCQFTKDEFSLYDAKKKVVAYKDGILLITDKEKDTMIKVDDDKIYIRNEDGTETEISSKGIISTDKQDEEQYDGFWSKVIGNAIQFTANLALTEMGDSPGAMAKFFINADLDEEKNIHLNFE